MAYPSDTLDGMVLHYLFCLLINSGTVLPGWSVISTAGATSFFIRSVPEFTNDAPNVVRGTIVKVRTERGTFTDGSPTIYTYADVNVDEVIRGKIKENFVVIRKIGGTLEGLTVEIPGSPHFKEGEKSVLFLEAQNPDASYSVIGLELGKLNISTDPKTGDEVLSGGVLAYKTGVQEHAENPDHTMKLSELRTLVRGQTGPKNATDNATADQTAEKPADQTGESDRANSGTQTKNESATNLNTSDTKPNADQPPETGSNFPLGSVIFALFGFVFVFFAFRFLKKK